MVAKAGQLDPVVHGSDHLDPQIPIRAKLVDVARLCQMITYHDESPAAAGLLKRMKNLQHVVFRLEAADNKIVTLWRKIPLGKRLRRRRLFNHIAAITNHGARPNPAMTICKTFSNGFRIRYDATG